MRVVLVSLMLVAGGEPRDADLLHEAESAFAAGVRLDARSDQARDHFRAAAQAYTTLVSRGVRSAALFRNQGHACLLAGDLPSAIVAYRRGLRLAPDDPALRAGLAHARERVAQPETSGVPPTPANRAWLPGGTLRLLALLAFGAYSLGWLLWTGGRMARQSTLGRHALVAWLLALVLGGVLARDAWQAYREASEPLIVVRQEGVHLRQGNGLSYPPHRDAPLPPGTEATLLFERSGWVQVELASGEVGWLPRAAVLLDAPDSPPAG